jgi:hypothetical protein
MNVWSLVKRWLVGACVWYAAVSLCFLTVELFAGSDSYAIAAKSFALLFPFGLCMSLAGMLYGSARVPRWGRMLSHYLITVLAFTLFLVLPSQKVFNPVFVLLLLVLLTVLYWILFALVHIFRGRLKKIMEED